MPPSAGFPSTYSFVIDPTIVPKERSDQYKAMTGVDGLVILGGRHPYYSPERLIGHYRVALKDASPGVFYQHIGSLSGSTPQQALRKTSSTSHQAKSGKRSRMEKTSAVSGSKVRAEKRRKQKMDPAMKLMDAEIGARVYAEWTNGDYYWATIMGMSKGDNPEFSVSIVHCPSSCLMLHSLT